MKHLYATLFAIFLSFSAATAQEKVADKPSQEKMISKEDKAAAKAKKQADLQEAFNKAGLTSDEQQKTKTILEETGALNKTVKADSSLSADQKMERAKEKHQSKRCKT